ncbi:MAG TPA: hypothetical protein VFE98_05270 [Candidatus Bathyarchaeia archaeon]|nr:hypothetical protein [Candidatus Bathyarchaeia archaeon]
MKELKSIKKLLVLIALRGGASADNVDEATGMGPSNIRAMFPVKKREKKTNGTDPESTADTAKVNA